MKNLPILSIVTWLPTLGAIIILALFKKDQSESIKKFATAWFGVAFVASLALLKYDAALGGMQFLEDRQWIPVIGARYQMGADGVAVLLIVLTTLLGVIAALSSWKYIEKREKGTNRPGLPVTAEAYVQQAVDEALKQIEALDGRRKALAGPTVS